MICCRVVEWAPSAPMRKSKGTSLGGGGVVVDGEGSSRCSNHTLRVFMSARMSLWWKNIFTLGVASSS